MTLYLCSLETDDDGSRNRVGFEQVCAEPAGRPDPVPADVMACWPAVIDLSEPAISYDMERWSVGRRLRRDICEVPSASPSPNPYPSIGFLQAA